MCQVIQYNAQRFPILKLPSTHVFCLYSTLSRLNHSCRPNVMLTSITKGAEVVIKAFAIRTITPGDELCMSYLTDLSQERRLRREVLEQSFHFKCCCGRCSLESGTFYMSIKRSHSKHNQFFFCMFVFDTFLSISLVQLFSRRWLVNTR